MRSGGKVTLGDALSPEMRARMAQLRDDLERRARETVKKQMEQPKAPRQMQAGPSKAAPRFRSQASTEVPRIPAKPEAVPKILVGKGKLSSLIDQLRPRALVPKPEIHKESFSFWELPPEATVREPAPTAISVRDRSDFENVLSSGLNNTGWESGEEIFATIGLDFGTSTTKVIVRFPYEPGIPTIAIPAPPHCRSMAHPYLWQTVLWMDVRCIHCLARGQRHSALLIKAGHRRAPCQYRDRAKPPGRTQSNKGRRGHGISGVCGAIHSRLAVYKSRGNVPSSPTGLVYQCRAASCQYG